MFTISVADAEKLMLILARISALLFMSPLFDNRSLPTITKAGLSLILSLMMFPLLEFGGAILSPVWLGVLVIREILIGMVLGLAVNLVFGAVRLAGQVVGFQMGLGIVSVIDPFTSARSSVVTQFYDILAILFFFAFDAHYMVIRAIGNSFQLIPFGATRFSGPLLEMMLHLSARMFVLAIQIGVPVLAVNFFVSMGLGLLARTVPQMNVFIVGFPLKIGVGLLAVGLSTTFLGVLLRHVFLSTSGDLRLLLHALH